MKHLLITTIAAVLLVGCGKSQGKLIIQAAEEGNIEAVKQHLVGAPLGQAVNFFRRLFWRAAPRRIPAGRLRIAARRRRR